MAETHELRLKIDAAAAKSGSRDFTAAINAIKAAVVGLERDSAGAFTKLQKNIKDASALGKVKVGVDKQALRDLNSYAAALTQISRSTAASTKGMSSLTQTTRGLADSYTMARKTSEGLSSSILKVNSGLMRQIQLASQARSAIRQVGTAPAVSTGAGSGTAGASAKSVRELDAAFAKLSQSAAGAASRLSAAFSSVESGAKRAAAATTNANTAVSRMEGLQLTAAAAMRRAESEAARLTGRLQQIGDVKGINSVNQALIRLKAETAGGVASTLELRKAMDGFQQATSRSSVNLIRHNAAQAQAAAAARAHAVQQRALSASSNQVGREMRAISAEARAAEHALARATGGMRGLENAFSGTFQAGSLFRTMLGSITFGSFISNVFQAGDALDQFRVTMEVATGSTRASMGEMDYINDVASRLGVSLSSARDNYSKFAISSNIAGVAAADTRKIFESVSTAMAVLGKGTEDQNLAFMALEQMMSKGKVSSEELRRQLGERLPGAVNMMAQALGVGVDALQDMLKAGEINSADALPKFADILMDRFGPGLEQAAKRAGNNLQKLRNEITFFLEETAQSGFMQELSVQFRKLTDTLAGGAGVDAARKLGEGLAYAAKIGGDAIVWLVENLDTVGKVIKAIAIGVLVKQFTLMGNAVATSTMQFTGWLSSVLNGTKAQSAAEIVALKHTAAIQANTAALLGNVAGAKSSTAATALTVRAQENAARAALTTRRSTVLLGGAMSALGGAAGAAAAGAGVLSRALSTVAPVIGIAVTALLLIPGAMEMIGLGADKMGVRVDAALARAGVAFEEFGDIVRTTAGEAEMSRLISDIETLQGAAQGLGDTRTSFGSNFTFTEFEGLYLAIAKANGELGTMESLGATIGRTLSGMPNLDLSGLGEGALASANALIDGYVDVRFGLQSASELQRDFYNALQNYPSLQPLAEEFDGLIQRQLQLEAGVANSNDKLTRLFGTADERVALQFAETAKQVIRTGEGMEGLISLQKELADSSPATAEMITAMMKDFETMARSGASPLEFQQKVQEYYGATAATILDLRKAVVETEKAVNESTERLRTSLAESLAGFADMDIDTSNWGFDPIPEEVTASYEALFNKFLEFQSSGGLQLSSEAVARFADSMAIASPAVVDFKNAVMEQFGALDQSQQTYSNLDSMLRQVAARYPGVRAEVDQVSAAILENARGTNTAVMAYSDLERAVRALPWPTDEARDAALETLGFASSVQTAGNEAGAATGNMYAAAGGMDDVAAGAAGASAQVRALQAALAALGAAGAAMATKGAEIADNIRFETQLRAMPIFEREAARFAREANAAVTKEFDAALAALPEGDRAGGPAYQAIMKDRQAALDLALSPMDDIASAALASYNATDWVDPKRGGGRKGGGGGGRGRKEAMSEEQKAAEKLNDTLKERLASLQAERLELALVASGQFETAEGARLMAEAMVQGGGAVDQQTQAMIRQIDAAAALNEELQRVSQDPVKAWMKSVPNWIEAGQQIEMGAIDSLKGAISDFIKTGKFDLESLGESILGVIADIVADKAVAELANLFGRGEPGSGGLGGLLGGLFGSQGDAMTGPTMGGGADVAQGGVQAGQTISQAMVQAGQQVSQQLAQAMTQGGAQVQAGAQQGLTTGSAQVRAAGQQGLAVGSTNVRMAGTTAGSAMQAGVIRGGEQAGSSIAGKMAMAGAGGGGGGGFLSGVGGFGGLFSMVLGAFSEGGMSNSPVGHATMPASAFRHAPHFSSGTANTSGIPAVLHDNEAVIPLSKGRKIGVDLNGAEGAGGGTKVVNQTWNISTPDADSFRKSQKQIAADGASSAQRAMSDNR
ncbi:tail length tape-measure protein [Roseobacter phage DSS3P8]|nr:tail length tape-measure protein [Roseobacter phage DSS3P8]